MELTTNLGLRKPAQNDGYDVTDNNYNADLIDTAIKADRDSIALKATDSNTVHKTGTETIAGTKTFSSTAIMNGIKNTSDVIAFRDNDSTRLSLYGSSSWTGGALIELSGKDRDISAGQFLLRAQDGEGYVSLAGTPAGSLQWNGKNVVRTINGATADVNGDVSKGARTDIDNNFSIGQTYSAAIIAKQSADTSQSVIFGGTSWTDGSSISIKGKGSDGGSFLIRSTDGTSTSDLVGRANGALSWAGSHIVRSVNGATADATGNASVDVGVTSVNGLTGAVTSVERVNTKATEYIRFESGLQICWGSARASKSGVTTTFPVAFSAEPNVCAQDGSDGSTNLPRVVKAITTTSVTLCCTQTSAEGGYYFAIGWWK